MSEAKREPKARRRTDWAVILLLLGGLAATSVAAPLPDPTRPLAGLAEPARAPAIQPATAWVLNAIVFGPDRRVALINGQAAAEGEQIGTARVVKIESGMVILRDGSREVTLRLLPALREKSANPVPKRME